MTTEHIRPALLANSALGIPSRDTENIGLTSMQLWVNYLTRTRLYAIADEPGSGGSGPLSAMSESEA